jgi:hypothetical protein
MATADPPAGTVQRMFTCAGASTGVERGLVHRRLICCVLAIEIAEHDRRPLFDQIRITQDLRRVLADATASVPSQDLLAIPREDGALLAFVADAAACFATARAVRDACLDEARYHDMQPRIGIDLGPVEVLEDESSQVHLGGDGRRDAERLMRQGPPCQVSVTRSFFELLVRLAPAPAARLKYQGLLSDTIGRPLGWYALDPVFDRTARGTSDRTEQRSEPAQAAADQSASRRFTRRLGLPLRLALLPLLAAAAVLTPLHELHGPAPAFPAVERTIKTPQPVSAAASDAPRIAVTPAASRQSSSARTRSAAPARARAVQSPAPAVGNDKRDARASATPVAPPLTPLAAPPPPVDEVRTAEATVRLAIRPWGEVRVDGRLVGVSPPLKTLQLGPGRHAISIANGTLPVYRKELVVPLEPGRITLAHDFGCIAVRDVQCPEAVGTPLLASSRYHPRTTADRVTEQVVVSGRAGLPGLRAASAGAGMPAASEAAVAAR